MRVISHPYSSIDRAALEYIAAGFPVALMHRPISRDRCTCGRIECSSIGKHPRLQGWNTNPIRDRSTAQGLISQYPGSNLAIVTGSNLVALDIDPRNGGDKELAKLQARNGKLPAGPTVITGGGGRHYYFVSDEPIKSGTLADGVEIKSTGSCVVAPPSLHWSGSLYRWQFGRGLHMGLPPLPSWISDQLKECERRSPSVGTAANDAYGGFSKGRRNDGIRDLAGLLIGKNIDLILVRNLLIDFDERRNKPPLGEAEVRTIISSIAKSEITKRGLI